MNVGAMCRLKECKREHSERRLTCKQVLRSLSPACKRENEWVRERKKKFSGAKRSPLIPVFLQLLPPSTLGLTLPDAISNIGSTITLLNDGSGLEDTLSIVTRQVMVV